MASRTRQQTRMTEHLQQMQLKCGSKQLKKPATLSSAQTPVTPAARKPLCPLLQ